MSVSLLQMTKSSNEEDPNNEWTLLAQSYEEVLLPRFQPLYQTMAKFVVGQIQSRESKMYYKVLDYGTG